VVGGNTMNKQKLFRKLNEVNGLLGFDFDKELELNYQNGWQLTLNSKYIYHRVSSGKEMFAFLDGLIEADKIRAMI
jgi:hypothetical protein